MRLLNWLSVVSAAGSASIRDIAYRYGIDTILILNRKIDLESIRPTPLELLFYK